MSNKILKVTEFLLYFLFNGFLLYLYLDSYLQDLPHLGESGYFGGFGFIYGIVVICVGLIGNSFLTLFNLIVYLVKRNKLDKKNKRFFISFVFLPFLSELFLIFFPITDIIDFFYFM